MATELPQGLASSDGSTSSRRSCSAPGGPSCSRSPTRPWPRASRTTATSRATPSSACSAPSRPCTRWCYGSEELAHGVGRRIQWIHDVRRRPDLPGQRPGQPAVGARHARRHRAALLRGARRPAHRRASAETYYEEMTRVAEVFGCPRDAQPATYADFRAYVDDTVAAIDVTAGRQGPGRVHPRPDAAARAARAAQAAAARCSACTRSARSRRRSASSSASPWTDRDQARYDRMARRTRRVMGLVPRPVRTAGVRLQGQGLLLLARRHVRQFEHRRAARAA